MSTVDLPAPTLSVPEWSLSPSRALDFKNCALLYRFRVIDKLPEPPSIDAARGTVIHGILEKLFDLSASERTIAAAIELAEPQWEELLGLDPQLAELVGANTGGLPALLASTNDLLNSYFALED